MSQHEQNTPAPAADAAAPPTSAAPPSEVQYPEQKHAGAVGYGPNYHQGPTVGEKATGLKEELVGKMKHDQGMTQHGHELRTGILKQKAVEDDSDSPFKKADEKEGEGKPENVKASSAGAPGEAKVTGTADEKPDRSQGQELAGSGNQPTTAGAGTMPPAPDQPRTTGGNTHGTDAGAAEQAATVAPEGTSDAERQRTGEQSGAARMVDHAQP